MIVMKTKNEDSLENPNQNQLDDDDDNNDTENPGIPGVDGVDGSETEVINNPEIPGLAVFANTDPGILVDNEAGASAPHNDTDVNINDEPKREENENVNNDLNEVGQVPTQKETFKTMRF